jgi:hypothetical protein
MPFVLFGVSKPQTPNHFRKTRFFNAYGLLEIRLAGAHRFVVSAHFYTPVIVYAKYADFC